MKKRNQENLNQQETWQKQYDVFAESLQYPEDTVIRRLAAMGSLGIQAALLLEEVAGKLPYLQDLETVDIVQAEKIIAAGALQLEELRVQLKRYNELGATAESDYQRVRTILLELTPLYLSYLEKFRASIPRNRKLRTLHRFTSDLTEVVRQLQYGLQVSQRWNKFSQKQ